MRSIVANWRWALIAASMMTLPAAEAHARGFTVSSVYAVHRVPPVHHVPAVHHKTKRRVASSHREHGAYTPVAYRVPTYYGGSLIRPSSSRYSIGATPRASASDYLHQMSGVSRWTEGHCIRIYIAPGRNTFPGIVANCMNQWMSAAGHRFTWTFTPSRSTADYTISWTTRTHALAAGDEAGLTTTDTVIDPETGGEVILRATTRILTRYDGKILTDSEIEKTVLHEVGHGLGLEGHSSNPHDIMYYAVSSKQSGRLSTRDANTMAHLYSS